MFVAILSLPKDHRPATWLEPVRQWSSVCYRNMLLYLRSQCSVGCRCGIVYVHACRRYCFVTPVERSSSSVTFDPARSPSWFWFRLSFDKQTVPVQTSLLSSALQTYSNLLELWWVTSQVWIAYSPVCQFWLQVPLRIFINFYIVKYGCFLLPKPEWFIKKHGQPYILWVPSRNFLCCDSNIYTSVNIVSFFGFLANILNSLQHDSTREDLFWCSFVRQSLYQTPTLCTIYVNFKVIYSVSRNDGHHLGLMPSVRRRFQSYNVYKVWRFEDVQMTDTLVIICNPSKFELVLCVLQSSVLQITSSIVLEAKSTKEQTSR